MRAIFRLVGANINEMLKEFQLVKGQLLRRGKPCGSLGGKESCQHYVMIKGNRVLTADIAWTLHYGHAPLWPLWRFDPDPENVAPGNLYPMRFTSVRCRLIRSKKGYKHSLSQRWYLDRNEAQLGWRAVMRERLEEDKQYCIQQGTLQTQQLRVHAPHLAPMRQIEEFEPYIVDQPMNRRPKAPENGRAHFCKGKWVIVNKPQFIGDDYLLRVRAALAFLDGRAPTWDSEPVKRWKERGAKPVSWLQQQAASQALASNQRDAGSARGTALPVADAALVAVV